MFLNGTVHDSMATVIVAQLLFLEAEDQTKPIFLYINSPGGMIRNVKMLIFNCVIGTRMQEVLLLECQSTIPCNIYLPQ